MSSKPSRITESVVEQVALDWLESLGYEILSGLVIAPGEPAAERADYKQVFLFGRLQAKLEDLNPKIPLEGLQEALRKVRLVSLPTLIENNARFIGCWLKAWTWSFAIAKGKSFTTRSG